MTVSTVVDHNDYTGNGVTTSFPYTFRIFKKTDLAVSVIDLNENITVLVLDTDYTVTNAGGYNGGNVVLTAPLATGWQISIARELEPTQETDLRNQGKFFAEVHEDAFDKLTMLIQQVASMFRLALRKPSSIANWYDALNNYIRNLRDPRDPQDAATKNYVDTLANSNFSRTLRVPEPIPQLPDAATRANKMPAFDSAGNPIVVIPPSGSASDVLIELAKPTGSGLVGFDPSLTYPSGTAGYWLDEALSHTQKNIVFATADAGIPNDGSDVSAQVSTFLNANKGKFIVFDSGTYMFAGVVLSGTGWEGTTIIFKGYHLMSPNTDGSNNLAGSWSGLILGSNVNDVTLYYRGDGNKANQYNREHIFNVIVHGAQNIKIPFADIREIRGDGIYITRDVVSYVNAKNLYIGYVNIYNSTKDGRNGVSITSCDGGHIDYFRSENVGGIVGGVQQPGGLDIEPNADPGNTFLVRDFTVDFAVAINAGSVGVGLVGMSDLMRIKNCHIKQAYVKTMGSIRMTGCQDSSIVGMADTVGTGAASIIHSADRCSFDINVTGAGFAAQVGILGNVKDTSIKIKGSAISNTGVLVAAAERCSFDIDIPNFDKSGGSSNYIGLWFRNPNNNASPVVRDCTFKLVCPASSGANQAVNWLSTDTTPVTFANSNKLLSDSNFVGYANFTTVVGSAGDKITKEPGIPGLTSVSSIPANGAFRAGDIVYSSSPGTLTFGWVRLTNGTSHVLGTDWGRLTYSNT